MSRERVVRHVFISGRVQGIGFRVWVERQALLHGIEGWVRNHRDGTVEALFVGRQGDVDAMVEACRRGSPLSRIARVDVRDGELLQLAAKPAAEKFSLLPTV
jgi:acylphosphatase